MMRIHLPAAVSFEDGQRKLFGLLSAGAGVLYGIAAIVAAALVVFYDWPAELAKLRLIILGCALGGAVLGSIAVTLGLLVGGPVGKVSVEGTKDGARLSAESREAAVATATAVASAPAPKPDRSAE